MLGINMKGIHRSHCILASQFSNCHLPLSLRATCQILLLRCLHWNSVQGKIRKGNKRASANRLITLQNLMSAMMSAVKKGKASVLQKLLNNTTPIDLDSQDDKGMTFLAWASHLGRKQCAALLLEHGASSYVHDNNDISPLMLACKGSHPDLVRLLLRSGADPYARANWGQGPDCLTFAAAAGCVQSIELLLSKDIGGPEMIETAAEADGQHPLLAAAQHGRLLALQCLLSNGAKVNRTDLKGRTALLAAAELGDTPMVEALLRRGAKASIFEFEKKTTPLMAAASRGAEDTVMALLKAPDAFFTIARAIEVCGNSRIKERLTMALQQKLSSSGEQ